MNGYFIALLLVAVAGVMPFLLQRYFALMKVAFILVISAGSLAGLFFAFGVLSGDGAVVSQLVPLGKVFTLSFKVDSLSAFFLVPIFFISPLAALYSYHYLEKPAHAPRVAVNYFFFAVLTWSMALVAGAANIITFVLAWELMSLSSFFLVIYDHEKSSVRKAGYTYFLFAQAGAMAIFAAFALVYHYSGSMAFADFNVVPVSARALIFTLAFLGFGSKAGIIPLHIWLPQAHPAAPSHVSAIMSGVMIKMGIYGIVRIYMLLQPQGLYAAGLVIVVAAITGVMGVVYALGQHDLKRLLAYHSVENIGIILLGIGIGMLGMATGNRTMAVLGFAGGLMHVLNHAIFKSLLFMGAGAVLHRVGTLIVEQMGGLMKRLPVCGATFLIGSLAICGLPPFNGFVSEFVIYKGGFSGCASNEPLFFLVVLAILSLAIIGGLAIGCFTKVIGVVFLGEPRSEKAAEARAAGGAIRASMVVLAFACLAIGLFPQFILPVVGRVAASLASDGGGLVDFQGIADLISLGGLAFVAVAAVLIGIRFLLPKGRSTTVPTWGCGFTQPSARMQYTGSSFAASFVDFYKPFIQVREHFPGIHGMFPAPAHYHSETVDITETGLHRVLVNPLMKFTARLRRLQHGHIQLYIGYIFFALLALLVWLVMAQL